MQNYQNVPQGDLSFLRFEELRRDFLGDDFYGLGTSGTFSDTRLGGRDTRGTRKLKMLRALKASK